MSSPRTGWRPVESDAPQDLVSLHPQSKLFLRVSTSETIPCLTVCSSRQPVAKMTITVQLPKLKHPGQCISTNEVVDKLKQKALPHDFKTLVVTKNTFEFIRFEGEVCSKAVMEIVMAKLNRIELKMNGFSDSLKVKCAPLKIGCSKYEWETYFRDHPELDETKAGYRPDTIHITNLPIKWFGGHRPKTDVLLEVFSAYGEIRRFHVPLLDEMEMRTNNSFKKFSHSESLVFDAYIMYNNYVSFVKAMDALRGMKLVRKKRQEDRDVYLEYDITVDFDKSKHLSDKAIRKRKLEKEYGIKNSDEVKRLEEDMKKRKDEYETRIQQLIHRKDQAKRILRFVFEKVAEKETHRRQERPQVTQKDSPVGAGDNNRCPDLSATPYTPIATVNRDDLCKELGEKVQPQAIKLEEGHQSPGPKVMPKDETGSHNKVILKSVVTATEPAPKVSPEQKQFQCPTPKVSLRSIVNCSNNMVSSSSVSGPALNSHQQQLHPESPAVRDVNRKPVKVIRSVPSRVQKRIMSPPPVVHRTIRKRIVFDRSPEKAPERRAPPTVTKLVITTRNEEFVGS